MWSLMSCWAKHGRWGVGEWIASSLESPCPGRWLGCHRSDTELLPYGTPGELVSHGDAKVGSDAIEGRLTTALVRIVDGGQL